MAIFRLAIATLVAAAAGCTTIDSREASFNQLSCEQLAVALDYESRAERNARREGILLGVASIFDTTGEGDLVGLDSDIRFLDADRSGARIRAITRETARRCGSSNKIGT